MLHGRPLSSTSFTSTFFDIRPSCPIHSIIISPQSERAIRQRARPHLEFRVDLTRLHFQSSPVHPASRPRLFGHESVECRSRSPSYPASSVSRQLSYPILMSKDKRVRTPSKYSEAGNPFHAADEMEKVLCTTVSCAEKTALPPGLLRHQ